MRSLYKKVEAVVGGEALKMNSRINKTHPAMSGVNQHGYLAFEQWCCHLTSGVN